MKYVRNKEWCLILIDEEYHLKTIGEFMNDYVISGDKRKEYYAQNKVLLNRKPVNDAILMQKGDTLQIKAFEETDVDYLPDEGELEVVYEDDFMLVVNKPVGMLIHPDGNVTNGTLGNLVAKYYMKKGIRTPVRHIHRLDRDTTGLVMYAKSEFFLPKLDKMLFKKEIQRYYYTMVDGIVGKEEGATGTIKAALARDRHNSKKFRVDEKEGKAAVTHYTVKKQLSRSTLLEVHLETGRTHQIRVHMAYIGHPILFDELYGKPREGKTLQLQAYKIEMNQLLTHKPLHIMIPRCI